MELRVHGVGGPSPQSVMGCPPSAPAVATWRSTPDAVTAVRCSPIDDTVLAYDWRPLTSGSVAFALWPLLLPFCLVNLAGWMHPAPARSWRGRASRVTAVWIGWTATVASVVWLMWAGQALAQSPGALDDDVVGHFPGDGPVTRFWLGWAASVLVVLVVIVASVRVAAGLDMYRPPLAHPPGAPAAPPDPARWRVWSSRMPDLAHPSFFDNVRDHRWRWRLHAVLAAATAIGTTVYVLRRGAEAPFGPLGDVIAWAGGVQLALLVVAFVLALGRNLKWALAGPGAATVGVMLVGGLTSSAVMLVTGIGSLPPGAALMAFQAFGVAVAAGAAVALVCAVYRLLTPLAAGNAAPDPMVRSAAARRRARMCRLTDDVGLVAAVTGIAFVVAATAFFLTRYPGPERATWRLHDDPLVAIGRTALLAVFTFMVLNLVKSRFNPASLRRVGTIWDAICFWPRTFHPFAIRPYSERAVPELRVLMARTGWSHDLQVTAHSQGSVLVFAALLPYTRTADLLPPAPTEATFVTFGCPLRTIYCRAFPAYVRGEQFGEVARLLGGRWINVFRYTDHIGRSVFVPDSDRDVDVATALDLTAGPLDGAIADPAPGAKRLAGHNDYWGTPALRRVVSAWAASPDRSSEEVPV
jgi:hypothetical protein